MQERLQRSLLACQDKFETAKAKKAAEMEVKMTLESCVDQSIQEGIALLPHMIERLKTALPLQD